MKIVDSLIDSALYLAYYIGACISSAIIDIFTLRILNEFMILSPLEQTLIQTIIYAIVPIAVLAIVSYKQGYREASFNLLESVLSCVPVTVITFLLSVLFKFNRFVAGGTKQFSALIAYGDRITNFEHVTEIGYRYAIPVFLGLLVIYFAEITLFRYLGCKMRLKRRAELKGNVSE